MTPLIRKCSRERRPAQERVHLLDAGGFKGEQEGPGESGGEQSRAPEDRAASGMRGKRSLLEQAQGTRPAEVWRTCRNRKQNERARVGCCRAWPEHAVRRRAKYSVLSSARISQRRWNTRRKGPRPSEAGNRYEAIRYTGPPLPCAPLRSQADRDTRPGIPRTPPRRRLSERKPRSGATPPIFAYEMNAFAS